MKSVVSITTKSVQDVQNYLGYYGFGGSQGYTTQQEVEGSGSGIIVGKNDDNLLMRYQLSCSKWCRYRICYMH